tara:strand:+ start:13514 stop:14353 length:840 start_codon:yes stop_codon:yes gene_type:complete
MRIVELILDENSVEGIEAISIVENPAIEEDFIALKNEEVQLAQIDKQLLVGALLIPNKPIYRRKGEDEYYIYFSKDTIRKAAEMYLMKGNQNNSTLEHQHSLNGLTLVESWLVEDETHDKSRKYGLNVPVGTWMGVVKVNNDEVWNDYVKTGKVKGFSIEGYFIDKMERPNEPINDFEEEEAEEMLSYIRRIVRDELSEVVNDSMAIIDDRLAYATKELAIKAAQDIGCESYHEHEFEGKTWFMPCEQHQLKAPCTDGYEQYGMKRKNGKLVPNCIPIK